MALGVGSNNANKIQREWTLNHTDQRQLIRSHNGGLQGALWSEGFTECLSNWQAQPSWPSHRIIRPFIWNGQNMKTKTHSHVCPKLVSERYLYMSRVVIHQSFYKGYRLRSVVASTTKSSVIARCICFSNSHLASTVRTRQKRKRSWSGDGGIVFALGTKPRMIASGASGLTDAKMGL